ncbi:MAG: CmpA/NrtA family ABC transporter substrate-binding protein [Verrucomicrobiota bacterium]|nr:CmpA/NrtA family ABC transporter substrate-binding protein [Verrucomicrobiota bacterium]
MIHTGKPQTSRRQFLSTGAKILTATTLLSSLPKSWVGNVYAATDTPEVTDIKFGIIALTDCAPFVIAFEKGFFKKYGINATITKGASWAAIRDNLCSGDIQATHMLLGMPLASTMGLAGSPKKSIVVPWIINLNGQGITLDAKYKSLNIKNALDLKPIAAKATAEGKPLSFAMTFPPGTHAMWLRYWLGMGGINPDKDISLITVPPPQMIANMKVGKMDGFCVGEPWNARAVTEGIGYTVTTTQKIWPDHPEKVCAFTAEFAAKNPKTVKSVLKALHDASVWLDQVSNRAEACQIISKPSYINCDPASILGRINGDYDYGTGEKAKETNTMIFSDRNTNYPSQSYAKWFLSQYRRWGLTEGAPAYDLISKEVMRGDLCVEAMKEIGVTVTPDDNQVLKLVDSTFNPADPEAYAKGFAIKNLKG